MSTLRFVIARRPKADVAISYSSNDRGCSTTKTPHDNAESFDIDADSDPLAYHGTADIIGFRL